MTEYQRPQRDRAMINLFRDRLIDVIDTMLSQHDPRDTWERLPHRIADQVIAELGVKTASVSMRFHPYETRHPKFDQFSEEELLRRLGAFIASTTPRQSSSAVIGDTSESEIEIEMRTLLITKLPGIEP